jgi:YggT family protein
MNSILWLISTIIDIAIFFIIAMVVMSWLVGFGVLSPSNRMVAGIYRALLQLTEPILRPIRNLLPNMGGLDLSPLIAILGLIFLERLIFEIARSM